MSILSTDKLTPCGQPPLSVKPEARDHPIMSITPRLIAIALKKYFGVPDDRDPAVRMLLRNVIRLAIEHLGRAEAQSIAIDTFTEARR